MLGNRGIDHVVVCVSDMQAARDEFAQLGFSLTPLAQHPWGTANSLVQLQNNFVEIINIDRPSLIEETTPDVFSFGAFNRNYLTQGPGMSMSVYCTQNAKLDAAAFAAAGIKTYPRFDFQRKAKLPDGGEAIVKFSLAFAAHESSDRAMFFCCQQHAPEHFWKPQYQTHANHASHIREIFLVTRDVQSVQPFFETLHGAENVTMGTHSLRAQTGADLGWVLDQQGWLEHFESEIAVCASARVSEALEFAAFTIEVPQTQLVSSAFVNSLRPVKSGAFILDATDVCGVTIKFAVAGG